jgi:hypothetical protein
MERVNIIKKTFLTTKDDLVSYHKAIIYKNQVPLICLIIIVISILSIVLNVGSIALGGFAVVGIITILLAISPYANAKKTLKQNVFFQHDISVELSKEGMKQDTYNSNVFLKWEDAYNYFESKKNFVIFISEQTSYVIPKRIFSEEEIKEVSQLLKDNIIPPKKKRLYKTKAQVDDSAGEIRKCEKEENL